MLLWSQLIGYRSLQLQWRSRLTKEASMAITRVWIEEGCIMCGSSEENCPELLQLDDNGARVKEGVALEGLEEKIRVAADGCLVSVIKFEEDEPLASSAT